MSGVAMATIGYVSIATHFGPDPSGEAPKRASNSSFTDQRPGRQSRVFQEEPGSQAEIGPLEEPTNHEPHRAPSLEEPREQPRFPITNLRNAAGSKTRLPLKDGPLIPESTATPGPAEHELLADAERALLRSHSSLTALSVLDDHGRRFPHGQLQQEAAVLRLKALASLGRDSEALAVLEQLDVDQTPSNAELRVVRGELRIRAGACHAALPDFNHIIDSEVQADLKARALLGRGTCRIRLGDREGARRDFFRVADEFPQSGVAREAVRALNGLP
jgi:hypothetical protein